MKKYVYTLIIAGVALLATGCADEFGQQHTTKYAGNEIVFGGRAAFEVANGSKKAPATRTEYTGTTYTENGKTYEGVNWIAGDKVRIYSPQAGGINPADYTVSVQDDKTLASLTKIGDGALQWNTTDGAYDFYAVYPSPHQHPLKDGALDPEADNSVFKNSNPYVISGYIPMAQNCLDKPVNNNGNYTLQPNMEYAYMVAHQRVASPNNSAEEVSLSFVPIATAVEFELVNRSKKDLKLTSILVSSASEEQPICGHFTADLSKLADTDEDGSYTEIPAADFVENGADAGVRISVSTFDGTNGVSGDAIVLADGKSLKFTLFMLPTANIDDLKISLITLGANLVGTTNGIDIKKHKKTYLLEMPITWDGTYDQSNWLNFLPDNALLYALSIPGAGGAASGNVYSASASNADYLEQELSIEQLWNQGVRCFEFSTDVDKSTSNTDLGNVTVYCNNQSTGLKLNQCVKRVKELLEANPDEFAMVILTYQQEGGWNVRDEDDGSVSQTRTRNPKTYMSQLNAFWAKVTAGTDVTIGAWRKDEDGQNIAGTAMYSGDLTLREARGKLFCIARPTSQGEDNYAVVSTTQHAGGLFSSGYYTLNSTTYSRLSEVPVVTEPNILVVHGWGALKDKWYVRGYTDCIYYRGTGNSAFTNAYNAYDDSDDLKAQFTALLGYRWDKDTKPGRPFDVASKSGDAFTTLKYTEAGITETADLSLIPNFYYATTTAANNVLQENKAWVQEWARVSNTNNVFTLKEDNSWLSDNGVYVKWINSLQEKKNHIADCLNFALAQKTKVNGVEQDATGILFINSLCGYYINATSSNQNSGLPNSLTEANIKYESSQVRYSKLTGNSSEAGMCGDIATFSKDINTYFYGLLQEVIDKPGPMGIILMDRISNKANDLNAEIPSIIIANNFKYDLPLAPDTEPQVLMGGRLEDGDHTAAPQRREASKQGAEEMSIVWE